MLKLLYAVIILFLLIYSALLYIRLFRNPSSLIRTAHSFERKNANGIPRILIVGDSTGVGVGADTSKHSIAGLLSSDFPYASIENRSVSGARIDDVLKQFEGIPAQSFDIVLLQVGANDVTHFTNLESVRLGIDSLYEKAKLTGRKVFHMSSGDVGIAPAFLWPMGKIIGLRSMQVRAIFLEEAPKAGVHYIDLYQPRDRDIFLTDPKKYFAADSFHPSAAGYAVWYAEVKNALIAEGLLRE